MHVRKSISYIWSVVVRHFSADGLQPRRTLLYVPGNESNKIQKASSIGADVVVLDLEDGVAQSRKEESRRSITRLLPVLDFGKSEVAVRINNPDCKYGDEDMNAVMSCDVLPDAIMLPKIESRHHITWLKSKVSNHLEHRRDLCKKIKVIGQCETAIGMMNLKDILSSAMESDDNLQFEAFVFGSDDYLASIGGTRTKNAFELLFARQYFVMHVRGFGLHAIDMVDIEFNDLEGLKLQSEEGAKMGFTGKQVIHPKQVDVVNECFSPSKDQVDYARRLVVAFKKHQQSGKGAFSFEDKMIDMPSLKQAENVLRISEVI